MKKYPLYKVHVQLDDAMERIRDVLASGFINEGEQVTQLTAELSRFMQTNQLVLMNSCTSAITVALHLCSSEPGDVITTPMTCVATNTPIATSGKRIVWADVDPDSGMITGDSVEQAISGADKPVAVVAVAWAGTPPDLHELQRACERHSLPLILDAAHAFGADYRGSPVHEYADFTAYSFQAIKHITTGDGGALVCKSARDFTRARSLKWFGLDRDRAKDAKGEWKGQQWDVDIEEPGFKFNMNNLSAALGLSQVPHFAKIVAQHRKNAAEYDRIFANATGAMSVKIPADSASSRWVYSMLIKNPSCNRDDLLAALNAEGIMAGVVHVPNDGYSAFNSSKRDLPGVREFSARHFALPCGWWLNIDDVRHIASRVMELTQ